MKEFRLEVNQKNKEFANSLEIYSTWVQENGESIKSIENNVTQLVKDFEIISQEQCNLKRNNEILTKRVNQLEQAMRDNVVEINGIPLKKGENVMDIIKQLSAKIGFDFQEEMIDNCYRYRSAVVDSARPGGIVVRFLRKLDKEQFISKRKQKRNVNSRDLGFMEGDAVPIYINDSLTQDKRKLLNEARKVRRDKLYTFLW
ncbi:hypothetical protein J6590_090219, partial [Homalodisca vitripennis]